MKELYAIIDAYANAQKAGLRAALATVVKVEGSSYRRPGARILVTEDGHITGAISGGCLEGDAKRKALFALEQNQNRLVTYDSMDEEGELFGIQLGCNGIVHILFEPIRGEDTQNPIALLKYIIASNEPACLVTQFDLSNPHGPQIGTTPQTGFDAEIDRVLQLRCSEVIAHGMEHVLLDYIPRPVSLVIAGAGNDAMPLARVAAELGWQVTVIDGRVTHATHERFPTAQRVKIVKAGEAPPLATAYMLMSHNYPYDLAILQRIIGINCRYIGLLGPKTKHDRMLADLQDQMPVTHTMRHKLFGPAGLDIGAETAEEIALSVISEIKAVLASSHGTSLRDKTGFIHQRASA